MRRRHSIRTSHTSSGGHIYHHATTSARTCPFSTHHEDHGVANLQADGQKGDRAGEETAVGSTSGGLGVASNLLDEPDCLHTPVAIGLEDEGREDRLLLIG